MSAVNYSAVETAYKVTYQPNTLYLCVESCKARQRPIAGITGKGKFSSTSLIFYALVSVQRL